MNRPEPPAAGAASLTRSLAPWAVFVAVLLASVVCFFLFADRVPSLLQALADR